MNTKIKTAEIIDMEHIYSSISLKIGNTKESLEFLKQIQPYIKERMPLRFNIQKKLDGSADVLIETQINSNYYSEHKILIRNGFSIGYNGEGARGLMELLEMFDADSSELKPLIFQNNEQFITKRLIVEIEE